MTKQAAVRLPDDVFERLKTLADSTGRTATFYIREAIETHLEDLEDYYLAHRAAQASAGSAEKTHSLEAVEAALNVAD